MGLRAEDGLFGALEKELKKADEPLDCVALFDKPSIREHATTINRVSDYLGNMWRKGLVLRLPAPRSENTRSRWTYIWKNRPLSSSSKPSLDDAIEVNAVRSLFSRPNIEISEEGNTLVLTLPHVTITIKHR